MMPDSGHSCCGSVGTSCSTWTDNPLARCALVLMLLLALPTCTLEAESQQDFAAEVTWTYLDPFINKRVIETAPGKYGIRGLKETRTGIAVHVRNRENRTHGCDEYDHELPRESWIAVMERSSCFFHVKITLATRLYNASAVVIYNNVDTGLTLMQHRVTDQVAVFVSQETGRKLVRLADRGLRVLMTIRKGASESGSDPVNRTVYIIVFTLFAFILLVVLFVVCYRLKISKSASKPPHREIDEIHINKMADTDSVTEPSSVSPSC